MSVKFKIAGCEGLFAFAKNAERSEFQFCILLLCVEISFALFGHFCVGPGVKCTACKWRARALGSQQQQCEEKDIQNGFPKVVSY